MITSHLCLLGHRDLLCQDGIHLESIRIYVWLVCMISKTVCLVIMSNITRAGFDFLVTPHRYHVRFSLNSTNNLNYKETSSEFISGERKQNKKIRIYVSRHSTVGYTDD
jgi:hypothetical protein